MVIKENDFVEIDFDFYINGKLSETTNKDLARKFGLIKDENQEVGPKIIVVGKNFILKKFDEDILEKQDFKKNFSLNLEPKLAYGIRDKKLIKTISKSAFKEQNTNPVVGAVFDFNGSYGVIKSVVGGRVLVDFNHPYSGKDIRIDYTLNKVVLDICLKVECVFLEVLRIPKNMFNISLNDKKVKISIPEQLLQIKEQILKTLEDYILDFKDYSVEIEKFKKQ